MSDQVAVNDGEIAPSVIHRSCGGWLAFTPTGAKFTLGVTAATAEDAREQFSSEVRRWLEILESGHVGLSARQQHIAAVVSSI
jgi:hypothetical protein